jgi:hypothetical protein
MFLRNSHVEQEHSSTNSPIMIPNDSCKPINHLVGVRFKLEYCCHIVVAEPMDEGPCRCYAQRLAEVNQRLKVVLQRCGELAHASLNPRRNVDVQTDDSDRDGDIRTPDPLT